MDSLPPEILSHIFSYLTVSDRYSIRLLSPQLCSLVSAPHLGLFSTFHLELARACSTETTQSVTKFAELLASPLHHNISKLEIDAWAIPGQSEDAKEPFTYAGLTPLTTLALNSVHMLSNLKSLTVIYPQHEPDISDIWDCERVDYRADIWSALQDAFDAAPSPLTALTLTHMGTDSQIPIPSLPNLTHLDICMFTLEGGAADIAFETSCSVGDETARELLGGFCTDLAAPTGGWLSNFPTLQSFRLKSTHAYSPIGFEPYVDWAALPTLAALRSLDIDDLTICNHSFVEWLGRHGDTLQELKLAGAQILRDVDMAEAPPEGQWVPGLRWADVFDALRAKLPRLTLLKLVFEDMYTFYEETGHMEYSGFAAWNNFPDGESPLAADKKALMAWGKEVTERGGKFVGYIDDDDE